MSVWFWHVFRGSVWGAVNGHVHKRLSSLRHDAMSFFVGQGERGCLVTGTSFDSAPATMPLAHWVTQDNPGSCTARLDSRADGMGDRKSLRPGRGSGGWSLAQKLLESLQALGPAPARVTQQASSEPPKRVIMSSNNLELCYPTWFELNYPLKSESRPISYVVGSGTGPSG